MEMSLLNISITALKDLKPIYSILIALGKKD
jgi:hypothetical protein